ncbi:MAG TPA: TldD/PmbA family protein, partial [Longimicrobium sp.]
MAQQSKYFSRDEMQRLAQRALGFSTADEARVNIQSGVRGNTRFAVNQISTGGDVFDATLTFTSAFGKKVASATTNRFDDEALRTVVQTSERLARLVPEDPEYMGELGAQQYPAAQPFFESTASLTPEARAAAVNAITRPAAARNLVATGFLDMVVGSNAVATKKGLFAYQAGTETNLTTTVRTPDGTGSGWAGVGQNDWSKVDPAALAERAIRKAELSRNARAVEPGKWTVILEPTAVANLVQLMTFAMGARQADEGRSFFSKAGGGNKIGEKFLDARVSIHSDPADPQILSSAFNGEGLPNTRMQWVENGVLRNLQYSRFWAQKQGRQPTGFADGFYMSGGNATIDQMIASTERGLLVTRLWYIRPVDPRTILYTGLTRDGTFLVEDGKITKSLRNFRFNESPLFMLNNLEMLGRAERVAGTEAGGNVVFPTL